MAPETFSPKTMRPKATAPERIPHQALATRILALTLLTSLLLQILACTMGNDDAANLKPSNLSAYDQPANASPPQTDPDYIVFPPTHQEFSSPDGNYVFVLSSEDDWASKQAIGELWAVADGGRQALWKRTLPHEYGPRFVLVSSQGQVLLLDEWINVASRQAVMLISRENTLLDQYSFDAIQERLEVSRARIVAMAQYGWWIAAPPTLNDSEETARIETAGKVLVVNLESGELSVERSK